MLVLMFEPSLDHCRYSFPVHFAKINSCIFLVLVSFWLFYGFEAAWRIFIFMVRFMQFESLVYVVFL
uniref:Uncharacterized protein n=1 Tax=Cannabis sativa TaxID=3483 RepID=A0A803QTT1_CANSA